MTTKVEFTSNGKVLLEVLEPNCQSTMKHLTATWPSQHRPLTLDLQVRIGCAFPVPPKSSSHKPYDRRLLNGLRTCHPLPESSSSEGYLRLSLNRNRWNAEGVRVLVNRSAICMFDSTEIGWMNPNCT